MFMIARSRPVNTIIDATKIDAVVYGFTAVNGPNSAAIDGVFKAVTSDATCLSSPLRPIILLAPDPTPPTIPSNQIMMAIRSRRRYIRVKYPVCAVRLLCVMTLSSLRVVVAHEQIFKCWWRTL